MTGLRRFSTPPASAILGPSSVAQSLWVIIYHSYGLLKLTLIWTWICNAFLQLKHRDLTVDLRICFFYEFKVQSKKLKAMLQLLIHSMVTIWSRYLSLIVVFLWASKPRGSWIGGYSPSMSVQPEFSVCQPESPRMPEVLPIFWFPYINACF